MNKKIRAAMVLSIVLIIVGITITVWAANEPANTIPARINYQGYLTNELGEPIDGAVTIEFRLYNVSGGGSALWTESHSLTANKGILNAELGGNPDPITTTILAGERWLGITVVGDSEMVPRKRLGSTPYSFYADEANNANTLDDMDSAAFVDTNSLNAPDGDPVDAVYVHDSGIVDLGHQSRARAFLAHFQTLPAGNWIPIQFDDDFTMPTGYDQQGEFTLWTSTPSPAFFTATETGYYQINARANYDCSSTAQLNWYGSVSIAIFVNGDIYAKGNSLQMVEFENGNTFLSSAPNVSDVAYLQANDVVDIRAWQTLEPSGLVSLTPTSSLTYFSIHKLS